MKLEIGKRLTNYQEKEHVKIGLLGLSFSYKRQDLKVHLNHESYKFLTPLKEPQQSFFLTNSGQVGIFIALYYIKFKLKVDELTFLANPYIGTSETLELLSLKSTEAETEILWICSSTFRNIDLGRVLNNYWSCVVIDSSCWSLNEEVFASLVRGIKAKLLIQIRSISKLDMNGIEYGSLGSVILSGVDVDTTEFAKLFRLFGAAPSLDDIPEKLFNEDEFYINISRCERIMENTSYLKKHLLVPASLSTYFPDHGKFFFIRFDYAKKESHKINIEKLFKIFSILNLDFRRVKSFGFNFWNLDFFYNEKMDAFVLRLGVPPILDEEELKRVLMAFQLYFKELGFL